MICVVCGTVIDPLDPDALTEAQSMCGECARARNFDQLLWEADAAADDDDEAELDEELG